VKSNAVAAVDGDTDGEADDLTKNRVELRRSDRAAQPVEAGEQAGDAAVAAARLGTRPRSAAMPSSTARLPAGASSVIKMASCMM
jgi:hypothetical protein